MDELGTGAIQLELKYCERCGGLWLRPKGSEIIFCAGCARAMASLLSTRESLHFRHHRRHEDGIRGGFWSEGGKA